MDQPIALLARRQFSSSDPSLASNAYQALLERELMLIRQRLVTCRPMQTFSAGKLHMSLTQVKERGRFWVRVSPGVCRVLSRPGAIDRALHPAFCDHLVRAQQYAPLSLG